MTGRIFLLSLLLYRVTVVSRDVLYVVWWKCHFSHSWLNIYTKGLNSVLQRGAIKQQWKLVSVYVHWWTITHAMVVEQRLLCNCCSSPWEKGFGQCCLSISSNSSTKWTSCYFFSATVALLDCHAWQIAPNENCRCVHQKPAEQRGINYVVVECTGPNKWSRKQLVCPISLTSSITFYYMGIINTVNTTREQQQWPVALGEQGNKTMPFACENRWQAQLLDRRHHLVHLTNWSQKWPFSPWKRNSFQRWLCGWWLWARLQCCSSGWLLSCPRGPFQCNVPAVQPGSRILQAFLRDLSRRCSRCWRCRVPTRCRLWTTRRSFWMPFVLLSSPLRCRLRQNRPGSRTCWGKPRSLWLIVVKPFYWAIYFLVGRQNSRQKAIFFREWWSENDSPRSSFQKRIESQEDKHQSHLSARAYLNSHFAVYPRTVTLVCLEPE